MGVYLSTPKTDKFSEDGENDTLRYGLSSMQGWRASMEDAVSIETFFFPFILMLLCVTVVFAIQSIWLFFSYKCCEGLYWS